MFGSQGGAIIAAGSAAYVGTAQLSLLATDLERIDLAIAQWRSERAPLERRHDSVHESPSPPWTPQPRAIATSMPLNQWSVLAYPSPTPAAGPAAANDDAEPPSLAAIGLADLAFFLLGT
jgi:hypothetical protein